jgi:hypothetical protein
MKIYVEHGTGDQRVTEFHVKHFDTFITFVWRQQTMDRFNNHDNNYDNSNNTDLLVLPSNVDRYTFSSHNYNGPMINLKADNSFIDSISVCHTCVLLLCDNEPYNRTDKNSSGQSFLSEPRKSKSYFKNDTVLYPHRFAR